MDKTKNHKVIKQKKKKKTTSFTLSFTLLLALLETRHAFKR